MDFGYRHSPAGRIWQWRMTGPEHFKAAVEIAAMVEQQGDKLTVEGRSDAVALALVHAVLAQAAASALTGAAALDASPQAVRREVEEWQAVAGTPLHRADARPPSA